MTVSEQMAGDVVVLTLDGRLTMGDSADVVRDKVSSLLQQGHRRFVLNLAAVPYMDSGGLGMLVQAYATATRQGGRLTLMHVTDRLYDLLVITKLVTVFDCFDNEAAALASFAPA